MDPNLEFSTRKLLLDEAHKAAKAAGVISGATHTEIRVKDEKAYVIESALRPGAGGIFYQLFEKSLGVSFYKALIIASIYSKSDVEFEKINTVLSKYNENSIQRMFWYNMSYKGNGRIKDIIIDENFYNHPYVDRLFLRKRVGDYLAPECDSYFYFAWLVGKLDEDTVNNYYNTFKEIENKINIVFE